MCVNFEAAQEDDIHDIYGLAYLIILLIFNHTGNIGQEKINNFNVGVGNVVFL